MLSHNCSHHMLSLFTFAPALPLLLPWCVHSPICFTQYVSPTTLWKATQLTYICNVQRSCKHFTSVRSADVWFRFKFVGVLLKWKFPCDFWPGWTTWVQGSFFCLKSWVCRLFRFCIIKMDMLFVVECFLLRPLGTRVMSHHGGFLSKRKSTFFKKDSILIT